LAVGAKKATGIASGNGLDLDMIGRRCSGTGAGCLVDIVVLHYSQVAAGLAMLDEWILDIKPLQKYLFMSRTGSLLFSRLTQIFLLPKLIVIMRRPQAVNRAISQFAPVEINVFRS
jgi:hypothetical protein